MIVTGAFFAEAVNMSDGKLNVLGAVWDHFTVSPEGSEQPQVVQAVLVVLLQSDPNLDEAETVHVDVHDPSADEPLLRIVAEGYQSNQGFTNGYVYMPFGFQVRSVGRHAFIVRCGDAADAYATTISLDVRAAAT